MAGRGWLVAAIAAVWPGLAAAEQCLPVFDATPPTINDCADEGRVSIALVGDVLLHSPLQRQGYARGFDTLWAEAAPFLRAADIAVANLEGPVAPGVRRSGSVGADPGPVFDGVVYTSYPLFNYHPVMLEALMEAGIDLVSTANNHSLDRFGQGADLTIDHLERVGLPFTGTVRREAERDFALETRTPLGTLVWISCTFSTNGVPDRANQVLMCYRDRDEVMEAVRTADARPDVAGVIVLTHWGVEYTNSPSAQDRDLASELVGAGAMAVVGTHPHVIQPWEMRPHEGRVVPVLYSTGNFVSGQVGVQRETAMIAWLEICRSAAPEELGLGLRSRLSVASAGWIAGRMLRSATRELRVADEEGIDPLARASHNIIEGLVPGRALMPRLECEGNAVDPALAVLLQ